MLVKFNEITLEDLILLQKAIIDGDKQIIIIGENDE